MLNLRARHSILSLTFAAVVSIGIAACGDDAPSTPRAADPGAGGEVSPTPSANTVTINILPGASDLGAGGFGENPRRIPRGTTVIWVNTDTATQTVTSDDGFFDSGLLGPGETFTHTFNDEGTFPYHSTTSGATGVIEVDDDSTASPSPSPSVSPSAAPSPEPSIAPQPSPTTLTPDPATTAVPATPATDVGSGAGAPEQQG